MFKSIVVEEGMVVELLGNRSHYSHITKHRQMKTIAEFAFSFLPFSFSRQLESIRRHYPLSRACV